MTLTDKRIVFVVGKGGTGKTTLSAALALAAAGAGERVLLVEVGEADALGTLFGEASLPPQTPVEIHPGIWGAGVDARQVLVDYVYTFVNITVAADVITRAKLFDHVAEGTPGLKQVMTLGQIWRWDREKNGDGSPRFDRIIIDAPATGHGESLLRQPKALIDMLRTGPLADQTGLVQDMLTDRDRTGIWLVTLPEELPVNEAVGFLQTAETELRMTVEKIIVNGVYPERFTGPEADAVRRLLKEKGNDPDVRAAGGTALQQMRRRETQQGHIERLRRESGRPLHFLPFYFTNHLRPENIEDIAARLSAMNRPEEDIL